MTEEIGVSKERLLSDMKGMMKSGDKTGLSTLRLLLADIKNTEIANKTDISEEEIMDVLGRGIKRRRESIEQFEKGGRTDLVEKEKAELLILSGYLPPQLTDDELTEVIEEVIEKSGATSQKDMGTVMSQVIPKVKGMADGSLISKIVKDKLSG